MADQIGSSGDDTLNGTSFNDNIWGGSGNDVINGEAGWDAIWGGTGNDTIDGGDGNDDIAGEDGDDSIQGGAGDDSIYGGGAHDYLFGGEGNDVLNGGSGNDTLVGGEGNDSIVSGTGAERFIILDATQNGNDVIDGFNFYADKIDATALSGYTVNVNVVSSSMLVITWGVSGNSITLTNLVDDANNWTNNILFGTSYTPPPPPATPDNVVDGTSGADTMSVGFTDAGGDVQGNSGDTIEANGGNDTVTAGTGADDIDGGSGDDSLIGNAGADTIDGGSDNDRIFGGSGADSLKGGSGADTIDGGDDADTIDGGSGDDSLDGGAGADTFVLSYNSNGDDTVTGFVLGTDKLDASAITSSGGTITVTEVGSDITISWGVAGNSVVLDNVSNGPWDKKLSTLFGTTYTPPASPTVVFDGTSLGDTVSTGDTDADGDRIDDSGNDIRLYAGDDNLSAGAGDDTIAGSSGNDTLSGNSGDDDIDGGDDDDSIFGGAGGDTIDGGNGADQLQGNNGDDSLIGGDGADTLVGGAGSDTLDGGAGNDVLQDDTGGTRFIGGVGDDTINESLSATNDLKDTVVVANGSGDDTVHYFEFGTDVIEFNGITQGDIVIDDQRATATDKRVVVSWGTTDSLTILDWQDDSNGAAIDYYLLTGTTYTPPTTPDLTISAFATKDASLDQAQPLDLTLDIQNLGAAAASGLTTFYWSADDTLDGKVDVVIDTFDPGSIAGTTTLADQSVRLTAKELEAVAGSAKSGYVFAVVDAGGLITEDSELNNASGPLAITFTGEEAKGTNLYIADIAATDTSLSSGQDMKVNLRVENSGSDEAVAESFFYWSEDNIFGNGNDVLIGMDSHDTLWGGESDGTEPSFLSYDVLSSYGDGFIFAVIDPLWKVAETDETDNVSAPLAFTVAAPGTTTGKDGPADFAWIKFDPARDFINDDQNRNKTNWKVTNQGETDARANFTVFWSQDDDYDPGIDVALPVTKGMKLEAGANDYGKVTLRLSHMEKYGDGYVFAVLDPDNLVAEADETNNVSEAIWMEIG